jgi:hypothetical protein
MAEARLGVEFVRVCGIIHKPQSPATMAALRGELEALSPFALAALHNTASLSASLIVGLAALDPQADLVALWDAASAEEDWQASLWGKDDKPSPAAPAGVKPSPRPPASPIWPGPEPPQRSLSSPPCESLSQGLSLDHGYPRNP